MHPAISYNQAEIQYNETPTRGLILFFYWWTTACIFFISQLIASFFGQFHFSEGLQIETHWDCQTHLAMGWLYAMELWCLWVLSVCNIVPLIPMKGGYDASLECLYCKVHKGNVTWYTLMQYGGNTRSLWVSCAIADFGTETVSALSALPLQFFWSDEVKWVLLSGADCPDSFYEHFLMVNNDQAQVGPHRKYMVIFLKCCARSMKTLMLFSLSGLTMASPNHQGFMWPSLDCSS